MKMSVIPENSTVWAEIPVTDLDRAIAFYNKVLDTELKKEEDGANPMAVFPTSGRGVSGHLYPGKPAGDGGGPTIHLACPDALEDALARVEAAGGKVLSETITIPAGRFAYCLDPDGNSIGIFSS
jgi:predicted enzyme related to lactoylglutathione lyase